MFRRFRRFLALLSAADLSATMVALAVAVALRPLLPGKPLGSGDVLSPLVYAIVALVWTPVFQVLGVYESQGAMNIATQVRRMSKAMPVAILVLAGTLYFSFREVSRLLVIYFAALDWALLTLLRVTGVTALRLLRQKMRPAQVLIVGAGEPGVEVAAAIARDLGPVLTVLGFVDDELPADALTGLPVLGRVADTARLVREFGCDEVVITLPSSQYDQIERVVYDLHSLPVRVRVAPDLLKLALVRASVEMLGPVPLIGVREPVIDGVNWAIKRATDVVLSALALALLSPVLLLIAIAIKLDSPGPAIFRQRRVGENCKEFWTLKFRTMVQGADQLAESVVATDEVGRPVYKRPNDPRVTRVGRLLRRTSLDELPQFINVLRGEMSLVGPRPEQEFIAAHYEPWQRQRLAVPPGITGWWQVSGRSDLPMHLNTQYDLYYIRNYSLWLDLKILWMTLGVVIRGKGAY
jgi:exopolysaccharide biosynthesis polyprenyl glycosylphosphotransferase